MLTKLEERWFIVLRTTQNRSVRIAVAEIAVIGDQGPTCGVYTHSGFAAEVADTADNVWNMLSALVTTNPLND
jgi:3-deoxy-D-manno-octulosonate 8-phosphate phosphatase KdsC-like HAD superfamily phosphatase